MQYTAVIDIRFFFFRKVEDKIPNIKKNTIIRPKRHNIMRIVHMHHGRHAYNGILPWEIALLTLVGFFLAHEKTEALSVKLDFSFLRESY